MYAATSIFRTVDGPIPAYTLAPILATGYHNLKSPLGIMSGSDIHTVTQVRVHEPESAIVCITHGGWLTVPEPMYDPQAVVQSLTGFKPTLRTKDGAVTDMAVQVNAFIGAVCSSGLSLKAVNEHIEKLRFYEIITRTLTPGDVAAGARYCLHLSELTYKQLALWLYTHIVVLFRLGRISRSKVAGVQEVRLNIGNTHWRDILVMLLKCFGCRIRIRTNASITLIVAESGEYSLLFKTISETGVAPELRDFRMISGMATRKSCKINPNNSSVEISYDVDTSCEPYIEEITAVKPYPSVLRLVSFPELDESGIILEHNCLRYMRNE